jgi:ParB/RepB/Spo0J family partition protein
MARKPQDAGGVAKGYFGIIEAAANADDGPNGGAEAEESPAPDSLRAVEGADGAGEAAEEHSHFGTPYPELPLDQLVIDEVRLRPAVSKAKGGRRVTVEELAASLRLHGMLEPISVSRLPDGRWILDAGAKRVAAARLNGWTTVPAVDRGDQTPLGRFLAELSENELRDDFTGEERRAAYLRLRGFVGTTARAAAAVGLHERSFRKAIHERDPGEVALGRRVSVLSLGQYMRAFDRLSGMAERVPVARREEVLVSARKLVAALEAAFGTPSEGPESPAK